MKKQLRDHIVQGLGRTPERLDEVLDAFMPRELQRHQPLLALGEVCQHVHFVANGCLQVYLWNAEGQEATRDFALPNQWCTSLASFRDQLPAAEGIRAVEASLVLSIDRAAFMGLVQRRPVFASRYQLILEEAYRRSSERLAALLSLSAGERIVWLQRHQPELAQRLSSRLLASYLGMAPETFIRMRAKRDDPSPPALAQS